MLEKPFWTNCYCTYVTLIENADRPEFVGALSVQFNTVVRHDLDGFGDTLKFLVVPSRRVLTVINDRLFCAVAVQLQKRHLTDVLQISDLKRKLEFEIDSL